jgi:hypothetical protein
VTVDAEERYSFSLDLPVRNEWRNVDLLRTSVQNCFSAVFQDMDGSHALSMVTGELLEKALKYGHWELPDAAKGVFRLRVEGGSARTTVTVQNPIKPNDGELALLQDTLAWIRGFKTAEEAYRARLLQIASADEEIGDSGLGLVRIAYEGDCTLEASVDGSTLPVVAELSR